ncbi:MAG TPA: hypothetical protein VK361_05760 [Rubrobacteraceae bacterium]|nr:hypothetical protein [Rubrobacteraceae bacterium]
MFFTVSVGVFVAVMVAMALSAGQSSAKENDCADEAEGIVDCEKGGSGDSGGGGGGNDSTSFDPNEGDTLEFSGGRGVGPRERTYEQGGEGGHGSLTLDPEGNVSGTYSGGGGLIRRDGADEGFRGGGYCTYDRNVLDENEENAEPECVGKEGFTAPDGFGF